MMRLPAAEQARVFDAAFVGILLDIGTSTARHPLWPAPDPPGIGDDPLLANIRAPAPPCSNGCRWTGDVATTLTARWTACSIEAAYHESGHGCMPLTLGGDHTRRCRCCARRRPSTWPGRADPRRCAFRHQRGDVR
ncbi:hypothetical protein M8494_17145 [Serratia ureilytica]